ncbi:hypothetical protein Hamer_G001940, partial [Homarus americanus]
LLDSALSYCDNLARVLYEAVKWRLGPFLEIPDIVAASFSDPRFKFEWLLSQDKKKKSFDTSKQFLWNLTPSVNHLNPRKVYKRGLAFFPPCLLQLKDPMVYWRDSPPKIAPPEAPGQRCFGLHSHFSTAKKVQLGVASFRELLLIKSNKYILYDQLQ